MNAKLKKLQKLAQKKSMNAKSKKLERLIKALRSRLKRQHDRFVNLFN